jgi:membrane protease YdiL (CAAX protease family)
MTSPIEPRTASLYHAPGAPVVEPRTAAGIVAAAVASCLAASVLAPAPLRFAAAQFALALAAAVGCAIALPGAAGMPGAAGGRGAAGGPGAAGGRGAAGMRGAAGVRGALGVRWARPRFFAAAIAIGATAWYLNLWIETLLDRALPLPHQEAHSLEVLVERPPIASALALFALLPAACEELVFRGVLARALGRRWSLLAAAAVSALVFSAYHLSVIQAVPTLTLGLALAVIAIRADSAVPAMLAHATNNALAVAMSRGALPSVASWLDGHPIAATLGCAAATGGGIALAAFRPREQRAANAGTTPL